MNLSDEEVQEERDDGAPIEVLEQYFEARGWACERSGEGEIVASAIGSWTQYELRGVWRPEDQVLQFLAFPDIKSTPEKRQAIYEALKKRIAALEKAAAKPKAPRAPKTGA